MNKKQKKNFMALNYIEQLLILVSSITRCVWIFAFALLTASPIGTACSALGLQNLWKSKIKKKKKAW